jgi:hypothetical protein
VTQALEKAKNIMRNYYNQYHQPEPDYKEADKVLMNVKNIGMVRPTKMLVPRFY